MNRTKLSVNVNKLATLRNSRGKNNPDVLAMALKIIEYGAEGITVHPRPDERHVRRTDVYQLAKAVKTVEFNIEGYPSEDFIQLIQEVKPAQATLVPDPPEVLTSNAGWNLKEQKDFLKKVIPELQKSGARVSLFLEPVDDNEQTIALLKEVGADRIELYTEAYADAYLTPERDSVTARYQRLAFKAHEAGIGVNAGHDLNLENLMFLVKQIPVIAEVSIGHALVCDALDMGMKTTIAKYLQCLARG
ncbi:MAG: pyridoxine 5'-phosphate synthase [Bdellovibrionales bacterium]